MHVKATLLVLFLGLCSMACQPKTASQDESAFRLGLAEDYRYQESMASGIPWHTTDSLLNFLEEGDLVLRFNSAHCLDCLKPIFRFLSSLDAEEHHSLYLIGNFDSEVQFKSYLKKQKVDHLKHINVSPKSFNAAMESLPGPYLFVVGAENTASRTFILDKYFEALNLRYLDALIRESLTVKSIKAEAAP